MKRLGQHFLKNETVLQKIAETIAVNSSDIVIEIGPGHGELTKHLLTNHPRRLIAIEKDQRLAEKLRVAFPEKNLEIIEADALKTLPRIAESLKTEEYKICGNIPYYITGHLFRIIEELNHKPNFSVFTVQKEVAERIVAEPPRMNLLNASVRFWADPEIVAILTKKDFFPVPKVDSAVIALQTKKLAKIKIAGRDTYYPFIKTLFKQPRKTILNNLIGLNIPKEKIREKLKKQGLDPLLRPQELDFEKILALSRVFAD